MTTSARWLSRDRPKHSSLRAPAAYETPNQAPRPISLGMIAPTILAHGTDAAKERYLRALHRGDIIACQLFSEPGAGSDLASLGTRAVRDGDEWVITGQKVWTSVARYADIGEVLCRTDPELEKHRGLTAFLVDMRAPGVEVRPLRQMTGGSSFNEVFFSEVRVPADHLLGEVNGGWSVALTTLMNERSAIGAGGASVPVGESLDGWSSSSVTSARPPLSVRSSSTPSSGSKWRAIPTIVPWRAFAPVSCLVRSCRSPSSR